MQRPLHFCALALACACALPATAQTQRWSEAAPTQRWSEAPARPAPAPTPSPQARPRSGQWSTQHTLPAPAAAPHHPGGGTSQWAQPSYTQRRSDADIQQQVDAISQDAARRAAQGAGGLPYAGHPPTSTPEQLWRDHLQRSRAQEQLQREQDAYDQRQRDFQRRY